MEDGSAQHVFEIDWIHGEVAEDECDCSEVFIFLLIFWWVDVVDVVGERGEYFLMIFEEKRVMAVDTVEHKHVERVDDIFSAHEGV